MKQARLIKLYESLDNEERITLIMEAGKREDREEVIRLVHGYKHGNRENKMTFESMREFLHNVSEEELNEELERIQEEKRRLYGNVEEEPG